MKNLIFFITTLVLVSYSTSQGEYYGIESCPKIDNSRFIDDYTVILEAVPTAGIKTPARLIIKPNRNFYVSIVSTVIKFNGVKVYSGDSENDRFFEKGVTYDDPLKVATNSVPAGLFTINIQSFNEFGELILCANIWI